MKFYGTGIVWNPDKEKALCQFVKGEFDTEEQDIIEKLIELGYEHDEVINTTSCGDVEPQFIDGLKQPPDEELKALAKAKGIKGYAIMKRETLIEKLKED